MTRGGRSIVVASVAMLAVVAWLASQPGVQRAPLRVARSAVPRGPPGRRRPWRVTCWPAVCR